MSEFTLTSPSIDLECDYYNCGRDSVRLFRGHSVDYDQDTIYTYMATYCPVHVTEHAADTDGLTAVGDIEVPNE